MQLPRTPVKKMKEWQVLEDIKEKKFPVYVENAAVERTEVSLCLGMQIIHGITCYSVLVDHDLALLGKTYVSLQEKHGKSFTFFPVLKLSKLFSVMKMVTGYLYLFDTMAKLPWSFGCPYSVVHFVLSLDFAQH